jgi:hypothetical protein
VASLHRGAACAPAPWGYAPACLLLMAERAAAVVGVGGPPRSCPPPGADAHRSAAPKLPGPIGSTPFQLPFHDRLTCKGRPLAKMSAKTLIVLVSACNIKKLDLSFVTR